MIHLSMIHLSTIHLSTIHVSTVVYLNGDLNDELGLIVYVWNYNYFPSRIL